MKATGLMMMLAALVTVSAAVQGQAPQPAQREASRPASNAKVLKRAEVDALLAQPSNVLVIDVRRPDEIGSIGGFPVYLNVQAGDLEKRLPSIPRERVIITVSNHAVARRPCGGPLAEERLQRGWCGRCSGLRSRGRSARKDRPSNCGVS